MLILGMIEVRGVGYIPCMRSDGFPSSSRNNQSNLRVLASAVSVILSCGLALGCCPVRAQGMSGHDMADMQPVPPPEQLPVPAKMTGIGNSHITIKATPEAQAWFDQGLSLLHDFWDYESAKAFEQAIRVDPKCAMCWWGLAEAEGMRGPDDPGAVYEKKARAEAMRLKDHASATDKLYIEAADAESRVKGDDNTEGIAILRKLVKKAPQDIEAKIFLAGAVGNGYNDKGEPKDGQKERIAILEGVMKEAPNDSAANHYWIHAQEPGNHPELALKSAALLASLAPNSGHMVHMPGHIFYRTGNYAEAEKWFRASTAVDEKYLAESHVSPDDDWNYVHNMMYGIANLMEEGKLKEANALSDHLSAARGKLSATLYIWSARDQMARIGQRLPVALRVGDWDAVLEMLGQANLKDGEKTTNLRWLAAELGEYARGMKALEAGDARAAREASDRLDAGLWRQDRDSAAKMEKKGKDDKPKDDKPTVDAVNDAAKNKDVPPMMPVMPDAVPGPLVNCLNVASLELRAGVLVVEGKQEEGKKLYERAAADEKKLGYHEPPFYIRPVGENEAAVLMRSKDYAGAKAAYEAALKERPNSGFGLYGLARVAELQGDATAAREEYSSFLKAWAMADETLPEVVHAKAVTRGEVAARQ
jgi:tetratricopeptide (TPR) repeat protein